MLEAVLVGVIDRLFNPLLDLLNSLFTQQTHSNSTFLLGSVAILTIIVASILGFLLVQHLCRWVKAANQAMQRTRVTIPETQKQEVTQPTSPISREAGTTISITSVSPEPLIATMADRPVAEELSTKSGIEYFNSRKERDEKYPLVDLLSQAKFRIVLLGGSLETVVSQHVRLVEKLLKGEVEMEFLIQDPEWVKSVEIDKGTSSGNLSDGINRTLDLLREIRHKVRVPENVNCTIKMYKFHATHSGIVIDPDSSEARAIIEFYPYDTDAELKPSIVINRRENEAVFSKWWRSFKYVLDNSEEYTTPPPKLIVKPAELSPDKKPREIRVLFPNGQERSHEAYFYFLTVKNAEGKRIKGLRPCIDKINMKIVEPGQKRTIRVVNDGSLEDFDKSTSSSPEAFLFALNHDRRKAKDSSVDLLADESLTFALFVTLKDFPELHYFADPSRYPDPIPGKNRVELSFRTEDFLPYHVATYEIITKSWYDIDVDEVQVREV